MIDPLESNELNPPCARRATDYGGLLSFVAADFLGELLRFRVALSGVIVDFVGE